MGAVRGCLTAAGGCPTTSACSAGTTTSSRVHDAVAVHRHHRPRTPGSRGRRPADRHHPRARPATLRHHVFAHGDSARVHGPSTTEYRAGQAGVSAAGSGWPQRPALPRRDGSDGRQSGRDASCDDEKSPGSGHEPRMLLHSPAARGVGEVVDHLRDGLNVPSPLLRATQTPASPNPTMSARPSPVRSARKRGCFSTRQPPAL